MTVSAPGSVVGTKKTFPASGFQGLLKETLGTGVWLSIVFNLVIADWLVN